MSATYDRLAIATVLVLAGATATILGAWAFELIGDIAPCSMCLEQRWAYYAAIPLLVMVLLFARGTGRAMLARTGLGLAALALAVGGAYAAYHAGVEWKWWEGPSSCTGAAGLTSGGLPDLSKRIVLCDEAAWRLFGLSLAGYNVLVSAALVLISVWGIMRGSPAEAA
ncbi:MAG: disulfide bond formation protein B [Hyphomicrobiales bacterium]